MLLYVFSATVKQDSFLKFRKSADEIERRLASSAPKGWALRGLYLTSFGLGASQVEMHWDVDSYAAFDVASREHASGGDYTKAVESVYELLDTRTQRARVLRPVRAQVSEAAQGIASLSF